MGCKGSKEKKKHPGKRMKNNTPPPPPDQHLNFNLETAVNHPMFEQVSFPVFNTTYMPLKETDHPQIKPFLVEKAGFELTRIWDILGMYKFGQSFSSGVELSFNIVNGFTEFGEPYIEDSQHCYRIIVDKYKNFIIETRVENGV